MDDKNASTLQANHKKGISVQERSIHIGNFIVINGYQINLTSLKESFQQGSYTTHETPHFLLFTRSKAPSTILVHWFAPEEITADIAHYFVQELKPFGIITHSDQLGELFTGVVSGSLFPGDVRRAWNYFGANTLQRLQVFLSSAIPPAIPDYGTLGAAATLYQRVAEMCVGDRLLDAGCKGGFLSLLLAERRPFVATAVGVDIDADAFTLGRQLAEEHGLTNVRYIQADLRAKDFPAIGQFDTVTILHVLEHLTEEDMYLVLTNLLIVMQHRLIIAVPYEDDTEVAYGHLQTFSNKKLNVVGEWCLQHMQGQGRIWCEDILGGLLLVERLP